MKLSVLSTSKSKKEDIVLSDAFVKDYNESLVHQAVVTYLAGMRQGSHKQKNRSEVRGGGKKPYRQKGTGRARAGTIRSPIWRGGEVTFASRPRDYSKKINKKMYKAALRSIFSELLRQEKLIAIEHPKIKNPKTKEMVSFLSKLSLENVLIITDEIDKNLHLASRNIPHVNVVTTAEINPVMLLKPQKVAITPAAGFVTLGQSVFIGFISAIVSNISIGRIRKTNIDDTLDVFPSHGIGGIMGMILTAIFAKQVGLIYGEIETFIFHLVAIIITIIFTMLMSYLIYSFVNKLIPLRVREDQEERGLDASQHGELFI